jgi:CHAD domain-containing protein
VEEGPPLTTARGEEFVIASCTDRVPERIAAALEPRFTVVRESSRRARQVWLDTFDGRLHAAGLTLRQVAGAASGELVLSTSAGADLACAALRVPRWPARIDVIPVGPLRDRLDPVVEIRALLPLASAEGTLTVLRVLNRQQKTVARITVDAASLVRPVLDTLPTRLVIAPVRGYQMSAERAGQLLTAADGFAPSLHPALESVLETTGQRPGGAADIGEITLSPSMPARVALADVLLRLADTITANVSFVIRDVDIEFLHDLRVAVRRSRSALKLAGDALPGEMAARFAPEFKWLGDLTTPMRDLDVYLTGFDQMAGGLSAASPGDLEPFRAHLTARRRTERRRLIRGLRSSRFTGLMTDWRSALEAADRPSAAGPEPDIGSLAADRIARAHRRVVKLGSALTRAGAADGASGTDLHSLRKRCKELRYLLEFFGSLYEPAAYRRAVKSLKGLQDCLGEFQDGEVQREAIRGFAVQMLARRGAPGAGRQAVAPPTAAELAATLLAMGELTAQLHERQLRGRAEVADRFARFTRAGILRTLGITGEAARS